MARETFVAARARLLAELKAKGWKTSKPDLKVTWAEPRDGGYRLWFKAQAIYLGEHSMFLETRGLSVEDLIAHVERWRKS